MENLKKFNFNIKTAGVALAAALIILVFFSRTIYSYNLPVVTAIMPEKGSLNKIELTSGIVSFAQEFEVYSDLAGKIDGLLVKEGDFVSAGDPLIRMDFGASVDEISTELEKAEANTESKLSENEISESKIAVEITKLELNIENTRQKINQLKNESYTADIVSDFELKQCEADIQKAEETCDKLKTLFEAGAVSQKELKDAESELKILHDKYKHIEKSYQEQLRKSSEQFSDKEESRKKQIIDYEYQLNSYSKDLDAKRLELTNISNQKDMLNLDSSYTEKELAESLKDFEDNLIIRAKKDAVITAVNIKEGQFVGANQKLLSCGVPDNYTLECRVPLDNNFIMSGDECILNNASHTVTGVVSYVKPVENSKLVTVLVEGGDISSGETFDIRFEKASTSNYTLVPKGALNMDSEGYFLSRIKRRNGVLGNEFYTEKLRVYIGDSDNDNVAIIKGVTFPEPVALISDKPFNDGETIKIKNESDFFED